MQRILRYAQVAIGPISGAVAQFLLALQVLHRMDAAAFGSFSFLMVASQLGAAISSALLCAPLPVLLATGDSEDKAAAERCLLLCNLVLAGACACLLVLAALGLGQSPGLAALFGVYGAIFLLRWFARAFAYAKGLRDAAMLSDLVYGVSVGLGVMAIELLQLRSLHACYAVLLVGAAVSLMPFGPEYLKTQFWHVRLAGLRAYSAIWRVHAQWSFLGVVTTELTTNAHAYIVTALMGPAAFAPVAASALTIRPISVIGNALSEYERPNMAHQIGKGDLTGTKRSVRAMRWGLLGAWLASGLAVALLLAIAPRLVFPATYSLETVFAATALWTAVALVRQLRAPESALLQASGKFKGLAFASVWSSAVSLACVILTVLLFGPVWSILGVLAGEVVLALLCMSYARHYWAQVNPPRQGLI